MKILLLSYAYAPQVGGIETSSRLLAEAWTQAGHETVVLTETPAATSSPKDAGPMRVVRSPDAQTLWQWTRWADVVLQNNISLRLARSLPFAGRPWVVTTQTWLDHGGRWLGFAKRLALRFARRIYISKAVAADVGLPGVVIGNPYDDTNFHSSMSEARDRELVVIGRMVSDKGTDLLIEALAILRQRHALHPKLTIVGEGPERENLQQQTTAAGLSAQVSFAGGVRGQALAEILRRHQVLVVPSRWAEPFGIVALEGIACGCLVVGSGAGGLKEAIGPCGVTYPNGDAGALASALSLALTDRALAASARAEAPAHLAQFKPQAIGDAYLAEFRKLLL